MRFALSLAFETPQIIATNDAVDPLVKPRLHVGTGSRKAQSPRAAHAVGVGRLDYDVLIGKSGEGYYFWQGRSSDGSRML
jgi:hypothetical protein